MRRLLYLLPLILFVVLAGYFVLALRPDRDPSELPSAMIGRPMPEFDLPALGTSPALTSHDLLGQVVLVNFFASWCVACRAEHPILMGLTQSDHVALYGIAYKDKPEAAQKFLDDFGNPYARIGLDQPGRTGIDFGVYGVPETYVVDKQGVIRLRHVGPINAEILEREILPLIRRLGTS